MRRWTSIPPAERETLLDFEPVPRRYRHDGWTPERQKAFIAARPVKDAAFERAMKGELVPVFAGGKLIGYRRKKDDALLMYILRHYGQDASGKRVTIDYFSTRVSAGAGAADGGQAQAGTEAVAPLVSFEGVPLDAEAQAAIAAALEACATRANPPSSGSPPIPRRGPG